MRASLLVLVSLYVFCLAIPVYAQPSSDGCTAADYSAVLSDTLEALGKPDADATALITDLVSQLRAHQAACGGLSFSVSGNEIVGPIDFQAGAYIIEATMDTTGSATFTALTDTCEDVFQYEILAVYLDVGNDSVVAQVEDDCRILVDIETRQPWILTFTPVQ